MRHLSTLINADGTSAFDLSNVIFVGNRTQAQLLSPSTSVQQIIITHTDPVSTRADNAIYFRVGATDPFPTNATTQAKFLTADGVWWRLRSHPVIPEYFGATRSGDDRDAINDWLWYLQTVPSVGVVRPSSSYRIDSRLSDITTMVNIAGAGPLSSVFIRNYTEATPSKGLFHLTATATSNASGSVFSGIGISAAAGTTGGSLFSTVGTADAGIGDILLDNMRVGTLGSDTHVRSIHFNGTAKATGALGNRVTTLRDVYVFGSTDYSAVFNGCVGVNWFGGGIYAAGGTQTNSGAISISGTAAVPSSQVRIDIATTQFVNLDHANTSRLTFNSIATAGNIVAGTSVFNTANTQNVRIAATFAGGSAGTAWVTSGLSN